MDTSGGLYNRRCKEYVTCEPGCSIDSFKCMSDRMCTFVQTVDQTLPYACVALYSAAGGLAGLAVCTAAAPTTVGAVAVCIAAASAVTGVVVYARDVCN